jgi:hypothetical protein
MISTDAWLPAGQALKDKYTSLLKGCICIPCVLLAVHPLLFWLIVGAPQGTTGISQCKEAYESYVQIPSMIPNGWPFP